ncbi:MAG: N-acetylmuramoyl-L-alanine amidase [Candidatus Omnitrophota bacterium]|nr:N-acetylmuramoyl-L-alanine amidase [Candidatus Omnitrophota bacterium]
MIPTICLNNKSPVPLKRDPSLKNLKEEFHFDTLRELMTKNYRQILPIFFIIFLIIAVRPAHSFIIRGTEKNVESRSYRVGGATYIPLILACQAFGIDYKWDSIARNITLSSNGSLLRLIVGSNNYFQDGEVRSLRNPVKLNREGIVLVPKKFIDLEWWAYPPAVEKIVHRIDTIIIDAGHGGKDPGAIGKSGLREKDVVLEVARRLKDLLDRNGVNSILTRTDDRFLTLEERTRFSNQRKADIFISIHANAHRNRQANGFEVWYLSETKDSYSRAVAAAENAVAKMENYPEYSGVARDPTFGDLNLNENRRESIGLAEEICRQLNFQTRSRNRGVKYARFYVLGVNAPAVLVELGFISNLTEEARLKKTGYRQRLAQALCDGIMVFKKKYDESNGFSD